MNRRSIWFDFVKTVVHGVSQSDERAIDLSSCFPVKAYPIEIPNNSVGFVYCLQSMRDAKRFFIGKRKEKSTYLLYFNKKNFEFRSLR